MSFVRSLELKMKTKLNRSKSSIESSEQVRKKWTIEKTASYGRIKKTTIGGFVMPRKYRYIKDDEKKLIEYKTGNRPLFFAGDGSRLL